MGFDDRLQVSTQILVLGRLVLVDDVTQRLQQRHAAGVGAAHAAVRQLLTEAQERGSQETIETETEKQEHLHVWIRVGASHLGQEEI